MIFEPQKYSFILQDAVYSLAVGFICGFFNRLFSSFLYRGKVAVFIKDVAVSVVFAVVIFSYAVSFANYRVLRWYNVLFALTGMVMFRPAFDGGVHLVFSLMGVTASYMAELMRRRVQDMAKEHRRKKAEKRQKNTQKNTPQPLQDNDKVLYN